MPGSYESPARSATRNRKYLKNDCAEWRERERERERERDEGQADDPKTKKGGGGPRKFSRERNANRYGTSIHPQVGGFFAFLCSRFRFIESLSTFIPPPCWYSLVYGSHSSQKFRKQFAKSRRPKCFSSSLIIFLMNCSSFVIIINMNIKYIR